MNIHNPFSFSIAMFFLFFMGSTHSALLTFDDAIAGETTYAFDGDADGLDDVMFWTSDPSGFNTVGPGTYMSYIQQPGLEGTSLLNPDLRVDFLVGASDFISFAFALDEYGATTADSFASFELYDTNDALLGSAFEFGDYTKPDGTTISNFPEGLVNVAFAGTASYGLFDFSNSEIAGDRYIIDNFEGIFGSTEIPEPSNIFLLAFGILAAALVLRQRH